ncbi:uncharacterized protein LOC112093168 [Morus notabilis]|uniref:uncharacterized protein LOC112093168 n=1 Tax=Morus notabilis TaxID=981085 RepID=UPI000CED1DEB|nr:uncharacterized protein LOC112093168 [Morus notabilis]
MDKLREFGRRALFYVRVLSGYEERRIRSLRLEMERRIKQAEERKAAIRRIPEQAILGEVRRMVEEMQTLNKKLEETEAAIEEYFTPLDKEAESIMKVQLEGEEKTMRQMMAAMQEQALLERAEAAKNAKVHNIDTEVSNKDSESSAAQQANVR